MGLAGMVFVSQLFPQWMCVNQGVLLVRPMLEFSKHDIYKVGSTILKFQYHDLLRQQPVVKRVAFILRSVKEVI
jgi:tRNA(Ile)-lysidine synthase